MLHCLRGWCLVVRCLTVQVKPHPDRSLVTEPSAYIPPFALVWNEKLGLGIRFACWPFSGTPSQMFLSKELLQRCQNRLG